MRLRRLAAAGAWRVLPLIVAAALAVPAAAQLISIRPVASGLDSPVEIANAGDGSQRLFIVEKPGRIRILRNGGVLPAPFLDIVALVRATSEEQGLLGLAFHPQYAANRKFYVFYTSKPAGALQVSEYLASAANPDVADSASARPLLAVPHPTFANHNGGRLAFGLDGYLYIGTGDGGSANDPNANSQNKDVLLGKILRIDVNAPVGYAVPPTNPFVGQEGADEVWAYGLRNPWKFAFDRVRGGLYIADVGQGGWEEINRDFLDSPGGVNFGWDVMEGPACVEPPTGCNTAGKRTPYLAHRHQDDEGWSAIIGGYVYRGRKSAPLRGYYLYTDLTHTVIRGTQVTGVTGSAEVLGNGPGGGYSTFGEDEDGELYVANLEGELYAIDGAGPEVPAAAPHDFDGDGRADVLWRNGATGQNYLFPMDGKAIRPGEGYLRAVADQGWQVAGVGDFDGDRKADILWRNASTGQNYVYFMEGKTIKGEGYVRSVAGPDWQVAGVGDFDGNGSADVLWRNRATGQNYVFLMSGTSIVGEGYLRTVADQNWQVAGVADFDGDGRADILWRNASSGQNYLFPVLWMGARFDVKPTEGYVRTVPGASWQVAAVGDFDGDGKADIFWRNAGTGENYLFPMTGNAIKPSEGYVRTVPDANWRVHLAADFDGDGRMDLFWRRAESGENYLFFMDGKAIKATEGYVRAVAGPSWRIAPGPAPEVVLPTLESIQRAVFTPRCAGCHGGGSPSAQMSLENGMSYGSLVNVAAKITVAGKSVRVVPGDPESSVLVHRLQLAPGAPFFMPRDSTPLPQQAIDALRAWISALPQ